MSYIIGKACIGCVDSACVNVCPVDCIHGPIDPKGMASEVKNMSEEDKIDKQLFINPDVCIKCGACVPECPVDAIYTSEDDAIFFNDEVSIHKNYNFFGLKFN